jgi:malonyl CoA-acyl carrier protein transacylase
MLAYVFPGQGSQKRGMGGSLFDEIPEYREVEAKVDHLLGYSMRRLCREGSEEQLRDTRYTQPALYVVNALHYYSGLARGERPTHVAGHSLGEYNALLAAGCFDFLTGLRLVQERGRILGQAKDGGMAAVIGLDGARVAAALRAAGLSSVDIANYNSPTQIVISGPKLDIDRAAQPLERAGARMCIALPVSAAFHSRYMTDAKAMFGQFLRTYEFRKPILPVISNVSAEPYPTHEPTETIRGLLLEQITSSVQWVKTIAYLRAVGVSLFKEIGPGTVLTRLIEQIPPQAKAG